MLRFHLHRLLITGILLTGFVGTGLMFGHDAPSTMTPDTAVHANQKPTDIRAATALTAEDGTPVESRRNARHLSWPFFSFARSESRRSW